MQGLQADEKGITLDDRLFAGEPFAMFKQSKIRERERDIQFMTAGKAVVFGFFMGKQLAANTYKW
jgi:hypothetical protein